MTTFIGDDFLLDTRAARELYHSVARDLPVYDFHCHLPVTQIAADHRFRSITEVWLEGDHYKWRAMRTNGVGESFCTGDASDWEKFLAWARTVPFTLKNPLYHWTHMELRRPFGIDTLLDEGSARAIFERCNQLLSQDDFTTRGLLRQARAAVVCTTDDPTDDLGPHERLAAEADAPTRVYPTWRPDKVLGVAEPQSWNAWVERLERVSGRTVDSFPALLDALEQRHAAFHALGCRASDHGLERLEVEPCSEAGAARAFDAARAGRVPAADDAASFRALLLHRLALMDHARGWVQQFHLGALRDNNTRLRRLLGADSGFDSIGDFDQARPLARFLDRLDADDRLAPTILYNSNPRDNELFASMAGNFQDGRRPGKVQYGAAWWFLDQLDGMEAQLRALSNLGLLARFVGMVTDSRSFLSFSRHDYFRRLLCRLIGREVDAGLLPGDLGLLGRLVADVCWFNAREYFGQPVGGLAQGTIRPRAA
jgi:glucuronate isomerase